MSIYRVNPIGGGGFKVHVADNAGGLRVVGVFWSEADANEWIAADRRVAKPAGDDDSALLTGRE